MFVAPNMLTMAGAGVPVTIVGTANATDQQSIALPTHAVGQLIVLCVSVCSNGFSDVNPPAAGGTVPAWKTAFDAYPASGNGSMGVFWYIATATNHTSGTWGAGSATNMAAFVVKNYHPTSPIGAFTVADGNGTGADIPAPATTPYDLSGVSMLTKFHETVGLNAGSWNAAPAGYTRRAASATFGGRALVFNTKDDTTSDASVNANPSVGNNWIASTCEIVSQDSNSILCDSVHTGVIGTGSTSTSYNHPVALGGADVFVTTVTRSASVTATGVTCGGVAMTQVGTQAHNNNATNGTTQLWRLARVAGSGNKAIVATFSGSTSYAVSSTAYLNIGSISSATTAYAFSNTAQTQTATVGARQVAIRAYGASDNGGGLNITLTSNAGGVLRTNNNSGSSTARCIMSDSPATATFSTTPSQLIGTAMIYVVASPA